MQAVTQKTSPIFAAAVKPSLLAQAVRVYLANARQAGAKTKTRSEVNRTKKKWFKQKGTGNARHGAQTPNIFVGGGTAHGPNGQQNYSSKLPNKMKQRALLTTLTLQTPNCFLSDEIDHVDGKTKSAVKALGDKLQPKKKILIVVGEKTPLVTRSFANLPQVFLTSASNLSLLTAARADTLIFNGRALKVLAERLLGAPPKAKPEPAVTADKPATPVKVTPAVKATPTKTPTKKPTVRKVGAKKKVTAKT